MLLGADNARGSGVLVLLAIPTMVRRVRLRPLQEPRRHDGRSRRHHRDRRDSRVSFVTAIIVVKRFDVRHPPRLHLVRLVGASSSARSVWSRWRWGSRSRSGGQKRSVPTILNQICNRYGGHGAKRAFAHLTDLLNYALKLSGGAEAPEILRRESLQRNPALLPGPPGSAGGLCRVRHHIV